VQIIRAQLADAPVLSSIAWAAKAHWGYPSSWMEPWRDQLTITPEFVAANETFAAVLAGQVIAFYALLETTETLHLEHLWVLPERIGQGIGRRLFTHAVERATLRGARSLTIEADPHAEPFYRRLGAVQIGTIPNEIDGHHRELPLLVFDLARAAD
jgi:GNAT superfamily N-acetyltransferase